MTALSPGPAALVGLVLPAFLGGICGDPEITWVRFNAEDTLEVEVTDEAPGPAVSTDLVSTSGRTVVGEATVDPGSGPVGTDHDLWVEVERDFRDLVSRVSVEVDAGDRGIDTFELEQDSADPAVWWTFLRSQGAAGETRTDEFTIQLWVPEDVDPAEAVTDDGEGA